MDIHDLASDYMHQYENTDVTITDITESQGCVAFDLSDGTHWFSDDRNTCQVPESLVDSKIVWDDDYSLGWFIINDDGSISDIEYL